MIPNHRHSMIGGENERSLVVVVEVLDDLFGLFDDLVDNLNVLHILLMNNWSRLSMPIGWSPYL